MRKKEEKRIDRLKNKSTVTGLASTLSSHNHSGPLPKVSCIQMTLFCGWGVMET